MSADSLLSATRDHVYPKTLGGRETVWCCYACNQIKGSMLPVEWEAYMAAFPEWWKFGPAGKFRARPTAA